MSVTAEETYHRIRQVRVTVDRMTLSALALFVKRAQELGIDPRTQVEADRSQIGHWTTVKAKTVERAEVTSGPPKFSPIAAFSADGPVTINAPGGGRLCELRPGPDGRWTAEYDPDDLDAAARTFLDAVAELARSRGPLAPAEENDDGRR